MNLQLFVLCSVQLTVFAMFSIITPFYPKRAEEAGMSLTTVGLIFSLNPIGQLCISLPVGAYLKQIGRRRGIVWSLGVMSVSALLLVVLDFCEYTWFLTLSIISRLMTGLASGTLLTIITAVITSNFAADLQMAIFYAELSTGLGLLTGPLIGACLYFLGGYFLPFFVFGLYFALCIPLVYWLLGPDRDYIEKNIGLNSGVLVSHLPITLDLLAYVIEMIGVGLQSPILVLHLMSFGINNGIAAVCYMAWSISYFAGSLFAAKLPKSVNAKVTISFGLLLFILGYCSLGPLPPLPYELTWVVVGIFLTGASIAVVYIPCIPSMMRTANEELGYENDDKLADSLSSALQFASALGEIVGPLLGGYLYEEFGGKVSFGFLAVVGSVFMIVYTSFSYFHYKTFTTETPEKELALELKYKMIPSEDSH